MASRSADAAARDLRGTSADGKPISDRSNPTSIGRVSGAPSFSSSLLVFRCQVNFSNTDSHLFFLPIRYNTHIFTMSFLGGAECSTAGNPLTQFTKHVQDDKSLQRDRLVGRGPGMQEGMRSRGMMGGQDQVCSWNVAANPGPFPEEGRGRRGGLCTTESVTRRLTARLFGRSVREPKLF